VDCEKIKIHMLSLLTEELAPDERKEVLNHMEGCTQCRNEMEEMGKTWKLMDRWKIEEPSAMVKSRLMAAAQEELQGVHIPWWASIRISFIFQLVLGALGLSMIIYLLFPYDKIINLCETNILKGGVLAFFPKGLIYFVLGLLYGLVPITISGICFAKYVEENPLIKGLSGGSVFAAFLVPFFIIQCPEFASGIIFIMALGIIAGSLSGGTGMLWVLNRTRVEALPNG
jgi:hypothetical protein